MINVPIADFVKKIAREDVSCKRKVSGFEIPPGGWIFSDNRSALEVFCRIVRVRLNYFFCYGMITSEKF